ncbi:MAG: hypothetical protein ACKO1U_01080, partial [Bacteroidota bacterium]
MKTLLTTIFILATSLLHGQLPDTDIFVAEIEWNDGSPTVKKPVNMTKRPGYDNQPYFNHDGNGFYFTAINKDTTQSDIYVSDFKKHTIRI